MAVGHFLQQGSRQSSETSCSRVLLAGVELWVQTHGHSSGVLRGGPRPLPGSTEGQMDDLSGSPEGSRVVLAPRWRL